MDDLVAVIGEFERIDGIKGGFEQILDLVLSNKVFVNTHSSLMKGRLIGGMIVSVLRGFTYPLPRL